jgi:hypothetical protein
MLMLMKGSSGGIAVMRPTRSDGLVAGSPATLEGAGAARVGHNWRRAFDAVALLGFDTARDAISWLRWRALLAVAGLLVGMRLHLKGESARSLRSSAPWWLLAAGIAVLAATSAGTSGSQTRAGFASLVAVIAYPLLGLGLLRLLTARLPHR